MRVNIIGTGISGLVTGALLSKAGCKVHLYEQNEDIGGVTGGVHKNGYHWDLGQLILEGFGPGEQAGQVIDELGIRDRITLIPADRAYVFPGFTIQPPEEYQGPWWRRDFLIDQFPNEKRGIRRYYRYYKRMMEIVTLARRGEEARGMTAAFYKGALFLHLLPLLPKKDWSARQLMDHFFKGEEIKAVFTSILADFVVRPEQFQGLGVALVNPEPAFDRRVPLKISWCGRQPSYHFIDGGCRALVDALADVIRRHGGEIHTGAAVVAIRTRDKKVAGIELADGTAEPAEIVVASGGAKETFLHLIKPGELDPEYRQIVDDIPLMESVFMLQLGLDIDPAPHLPSAVNYYYRTNDVSGAVERLSNGIYHEGQDGYVICYPGLYSPQSAPEGHYAVTIYTVAPDTPEGFTWAQAKKKMADKLLDLAQEHIPELKKHITEMVVLTPEDFRKLTLLKHHSFGGCAPVMGKKGAPHRTNIGGLWFIGAQSESGAGINNVIEGSWRTARMILDEMPGR